MNEKLLAELKKLFDETMKSINTLQDLNDTLIDQISELNLLVANVRKNNQSIYLRMLDKFDEKILEDMKLKDLVFLDGKDAKEFMQDRYSSGDELCKKEKSE